MDSHYATMPRVKLFGTKGRSVHSALGGGKGTIYQCTYIIRRFLHVLRVSNFVQF